MHLPKNVTFDQTAMLVIVNTTTTPDKFYLWITASVKNFDNSEVKKEVKFVLDHDVENKLGIFSEFQETELTLIEASIKERDEEFDSLRDILASLPGLENDGKSW